MKSIGHKKTTLQETFWLLIARMKDASFKGAVAQKTYVYYSMQLKNKTFPEIAALLTEMLDNRIFPDIVILNQLIKRLSFLNPQFSIALYEIAVTRQLAGVITYNTVLHVVAKSAKPDVELALKLLADAKAAQCANAFTYNTVLDVAAKSEKPNVKLALKLLAEAKVIQCADAITYNCALDAVARSEKPDVSLGLELLAEAKEAKCANAITYATVLGVVAKSDKPDVELALKLLAEAKVAKCTDAITYATVLDVVAKSEKPDMELALKLLAEAKASKLVNTITYTTVLDVIAKSEKPNVKLALDLFEEAKASQCADTITYNTVLDIIARSEQPNVVMDEVFMDEVLDQFKRHAMKSMEIWDLHGLSFGMVYFGLRQLLKQEIASGKANPTLTLIYGKGLHSRFKEETHPVKQAVLRVVSELSGEGVSGKENELNSGLFELSLQPAKQQSIASSLHGLFAKKLDPTAKVYVPSTLAIHSKRN